MQTFQKSLLSWYHKHKRDLPWRKTKDPYAIWVSEIMLQQTQVATVIDYYLRFLKRFPSIQDLADAPESDVLSLWSGLGYYSRARNLQKAAQKIVLEHAGVFPQDPEQILKLPGIGPYTRGAIGSIAFDLPLALVDGNVIRVYARLNAWRGVPNDPIFQKKIWKHAEEIMEFFRRGDPTGRPQSNLKPSKSKGESPGDFNQALMELGATICTPQNPLCLLCPVKSFCKGHLEAELYPDKKKRAETKMLKRVALVYQKRNQVLLVQSEDHRWMKSLWHLPGIFSESNFDSSTLLESLTKEWKLKNVELIPLPKRTQSITHHKIEINPFAYQGNRLLVHKKHLLKWATKEEIKNLGLPAADRKILDSYFKNPETELV